MRACENCEWWVQPHDAANWGYCKAAPPVLDSTDTVVWPTTYPTDWCGRFRLAERLCGNPPNTSGTHHG